MERLMEFLATVHLAPRGVWEDALCWPEPLDNRSGGRFNLICKFRGHDWKTIFGGHYANGDPFPAMECQRCKRTVEE